MLRSDLLVVASLIPPGSRVLDLGCGRGELQEYLVREKGVEGRGVEISEAGVLECVRRGLSARHGNLDEGLADYPDGSFDYVILSQTLPYLADPVMILREMLRVGERAVVSFPTGDTGGTGFLSCSRDGCRRRSPTRNRGTAHHGCTR
jgi:methionine biosynthesis protein MetW